MKYFSAGADLNDALAISGAADGLAYFKRWHKLCDVFENLVKPVFAAIEGFCMTGGCELALACDMRVAGEGSSFAITSSKIGTVAGAGGTQRLPRIVGPAKALEIMFSADPIDADEAHRIGLVNRLVAKGGTAVDEAKAMVKVYENRAPLACLHQAQRASRDADGSGVRHRVRDFPGVDDLSVGRSQGGYLRIPREAPSQVQRQVKSS